MHNVLDKRLFTIIKKCYQEKFWESFDDSHLIALHLPKEKEPIFISIMGKEAEAYGFLIYRGYKELAYLYHALNRPDDSSIPLIYQDCLAIYFEDRQDLQQAEYHRIKESGVKFRGRQAWPILVDFKPGYLPSIYQENNILWLIHCLECFYDTAIDLRERLHIFEQTEIQQLYAFPGRAYDQDMNHHTRLFEVPDIYRQGITINSFGSYPLIVSDFELLRVQQLPFKQTIWEMDLSTVQLPTEGSDNQLHPARPFYPFLFMMADEGTQEILTLNLLKTDDVEAFQRSLIRLFINKDCRPTAICIKNNIQTVYLHAYFSKLLESLSIDIHVSDSLTVIDFLRADLGDVTLTDD